MQQLTQHLTEEQLISHYYRDGDAPFAPEHLAACDECRAQFATLCSVLTLVDQLPIPAGEITLSRLSHLGWIEMRGEYQHTEARTSIKRSFV